MTMKLLSADAFRDAAKSGERPEGTVFRFASAEPEMQDEDTRTIRFVFSDGTVDHAGDSINQEGWDLSIFKRNPVALFSHMSWEPPIGRASNVDVANGKLAGDIEFATPDIYEFADTIYRLVKGKFLKAVSVGFMPKEWVWSQDKDRPYGIDFVKQTLLEISVCPVPCNPNALSEARSMGVNTSPLAEWAEKVLDNGDTVLLPRKEVEQLRTQAKQAPQPRYYLHVPPKLKLTVEAAEGLREHMRKWLTNPAEPLILEGGIEVRSINGEPEASPDVSTTETCGAALEDQCTLPDPLTCATHSAVAKAQANKSGRRISAASRSRLEAAMQHHESATKCIKDVLGDDDADEEPDADADDQTVQDLPPGTVVPDNATPEERRLAEARALKASLTPND